MRTSLLTVQRYENEHYMHISLPLNSQHSLSRRFVLSQSLMKAIFFQLKSSKLLIMSPMTINHVRVCESSGEAKSTKTICEGMGSKIIIHDFLNWSDLSFDKKYASVIYMKPEKIADVLLKLGKNVKFPLVENNWQMSHPRADLWWQMPHRGDRQKRQLPDGWSRLELTEPYNSNLIKLSDILLSTVHASINISGR